jgi:hypothetical protein
MILWAQAPRWASSSISRRSTAAPSATDCKIAYHLTLRSCLAGKDKATAWAI